MAADDFMEGEVGVAVAATAAALSPRARELMRRGAVYGLAGALTVGDMAFAMARGVRSGSAPANGRSPSSRTGSQRRRSPRATATPRKSPARQNG